MNHKHRPPRPVTLLAERPHPRYNLDRLVEGLRDPAPRQGAGHRVWRPVSALDARLRAIPAAEYVQVLAGLEPDRGGKVRCPFHPLSVRSESAASVSAARSCADASVNDRDDGR
jgi:hypothetical protein